MSNDFSYELPMERKMELLRTATSVAARGERLGTRGESIKERGDQPISGNPRPLKFQAATSSTTVHDVGGGKVRTPDAPTTNRASRSLFEHPFRMVSTTTEDGDPAVEVASEWSSVTDSLNGAPLAIDGFDTALTDLGAVVLECVTNPDLTVLSSTIKIMDPLLFNAIEVDGGTGEQTHARLLIGYYGEGEEEGQRLLRQAIFTSQTLGHGFYNGALVRVFREGPTNKNTIVPA